MKTTDEIFEEMKALYEERSGLALADGGDMYLRLYAAASQLYTLWVQADFVTRQAFPQTAEGTYLDYHAEIRGLERLEAVKSAGELRFSVGSARTASVTIPAGTACMTENEAEFATTEQGVIPAGSVYCDVPARAMQAGAAGNVPAGAVNVMELAPAGVTSCYNPAAFTGGTDAESDAALRVRVLASYRKLPNGANAAYYEARALDIDGVAAASVLPKNRGVGTVDIIIASAGGVPSAELVNAVKTRLQAEREICVDIGVSAPETVTVDVAVRVSPAAGYSGAAVAAKVKAALTAYFDGRLLGQNVLLAKLGSVIYSVEGVKNYVFSAPAADVAVTGAQLPVLGALTVTEA
jgi:uncharacterized phage protein gp47/JayE